MQEKYRNPPACRQFRNRYARDQSTRHRWQQSTDSKPGADTDSVAVNTGRQTQP